MKKETFLAYRRKAGAFVSVIGKNPYAVFGLGMLLGFAFFSVIYGLKVVNPTFTDWVAGGGDIKQHFLGWEFYRSEPWSFPIGAIYSLAYPFGISLTYMDSIPLMGILFKLLSPLLPHNFQYLGMWGLLCFMLQGGFAALIIRRWSKNIFVILLAASFFVISPVFLGRMFIHTALASQWIILAAIYALLEWKRLISVKKFTIIWTVLLVLAATIHPYFLPMVGILFAISLTLSHTKWSSLAIKMIIPFVTAIVVFWLIGGFMVGATDNTSMGLGEYGLNLDSLYNPLGWSRYLRNIPNFSPSGETLAYLGLGLLMLVPLVIYIALLGVKKRDLRKLKQKISIRYALVVFFVLILCILAISPRVQFGMQERTYYVPHKIENYWAIFRSSARLFWPVYYLVIVGLLAYVIRSFKKQSVWLLAAFLAIVLLIQGIDVGTSPGVKGERHRFQVINKPGFAYRPPLDANIWDKAAKGRRHLVYLGKETTNDFFGLSDVAVRNGMTMNKGYFARSPDKDIAQFEQQQMNLLTKKKADTKVNFYVTKDAAVKRKLKKAGYKLYALSRHFVTIK